MKLSIMGMEVETKWIETLYPLDYEVTQVILAPGMEPMYIPLVGNYMPDPGMKNWHWQEELDLNGIIAIYDESPLDKKGD